VKYCLVIFDFDGTLADSGLWFTRVINELAHEFRFKRLEQPDYERVRRYDARGVLKHLGIPMWKAPRVLIRLRQHAARDAAQIPVFPGVEAMFERLMAAGRTVAISSSNSEETVRKVLGGSIAARVPHFKCGASLFGKAAKLKQLLVETQTARDQAIYVGDEIRDVEAARQAGVAFGGVRWGYTEPEALRAAAPDYFFQTIDEIELLP